MISSVDLGFITIHFYSLCILLAILVGGKIVLKESLRWNIPENFMFNMIFRMIIIGVIGARAYYVIFNFDYYSNNLIEIPMVWYGGLAIHGGIIGALCVLLFYAHKYKARIATLLDIVVPGLIIGQAIGRWGNFFNGEAHGPATTLNYLQDLHLPSFIIDGMYINGVYYIPTFLYESLWCLIGFVLLLIIRKLKYCKIGEPLSFYLIWYGIGRFMIESMRTDSLMLFSMKMAQVISILMIICGLILFIYFKFRGSRDDYLYNDRENNLKINY